MRLDGVPIVTGVDLAVAPGELVALVGESGCGKTSIALACLGYARPGTRLQGGSIDLGGDDLLALDEPLPEALLKPKRSSAAPRGAPKA